MKIINRQIKIIPKVKVNVRYIIKEEDRIIIAIAKFKDHSDYNFIKQLHFKVKDIHKNYNDDNSNDESIVINYLKNYCRDYGFEPEWNPNVEKRLKMSSQYTSTAKCDPADEWDEQKGLEIVADKIAFKIATAIDKRIEYGLKLFKSASGRF